MLHALGNLCAATGRVDESFIHHKDALEHFQETRGNNDHRTADMSYKVAEHHFIRGNIDDALYV